MLTFHDYGTYCLRTEFVSNTLCNLLACWIRNEALPEMHRLSWITETPDSTLEEKVLPLLTKRTKRLKGLDIVQISGQEKPGSIRDLCRMINSLSPISPGIVFIEKMEHWLSKPNNQMLQTDTAQQIQSLNQWCTKKQLVIVALISKELPVWSTFMHGLSVVSENAEPVTTPWWLRPWGYQGGLWHFEPDTDHKQVLLDERYYSTLGELSRDLHLLRLHTDEQTNIHVKLSKWDKNSTEAVVLLRLGADSVIRNLEEWKIEHPKSSKHLKIFNRAELPDDTNLIFTFGVTLQEIITPGQLKFLSAKDFSAHSTMLSRMAPKWDVFCSLTRLSLLNHINATQAAKLTNVLSMQCYMLATSEAFYLFRIWESPPTEAKVHEHLESCFSVNIQSLFAGTSHYMQNDSIRVVLKSLSGYEAAFIADIMEDSYSQHASSLHEVWDDVKKNPEGRPWVNRLANLAGISELLRGSQLYEEENT